MVERVKDLLLYNLLQGLYGKCIDGYIFICLLNDTKPKVVQLLMVFHFIYSLFLGCLGLKPSREVVVDDIWMDIYLKLGLSTAGRGTGPGLCKHHSNYTERRT